jgi:hypothetical protein
VVRRTAGGLARFCARNWIDLLLVAAVLVVVGPIVTPWQAQAASRMALTDSVATRGTVDLAHEPLGIDHSKYHGHLRSDKAPGQPILTVPVYAAARAVGAESTARYRLHGNLTQWWETLWAATVPFAILLILLRRHAARYAPKLALPVTLAFGASTMLLPLGINLFGHMLAACLVFGVWTLLDREHLAPGPLVGAGLLAGAAVFVEYEALMVVAVLTLFTIWRFRGRVGWFFAGAVPGALALSVYQWRAFGAPWALPYSSYVGSDSGANMGGRLPVLPAISLLFSPSRGLILTSPLIIVALVAAFLVARDRAHPARHVAIVVLASFAAVLFLVATFEGSDLAEMPGPRFLLTGIPFLVTPLAVSWKRVAIFARPAVWWGVLMNAIATWAFYFVSHNASLWNYYTHEVADRAFNPTVWSIGLGRAGIVIYLASVVAIIVLLDRALKKDAADREREFVGVP